MKPIRLRATAFGPFGSSVDVDFDRVADLGLFVVAGDTGAGKTSIFDAMYYALYGALPGDRVRSGNIRSDHATPDAECEVSLEFLAQGQLWRITRKPTQTRAKRRGDGVTEVKATAAFERREGDDWHPVAAGVIDVDRQLQPIIGLTGPQFERVVLLPQGKFRRVLDAKSSEREDLLRTLFGSEIFDVATRRLREQARSLTDDLRDQVAEHERALQSISAALDASEGPSQLPVQTGTNVLMLHQPQPELLDAAASDDPLPVTTASLRRRIAEASRDRLAPVDAKLASVEREAAVASQRVVFAESQAEMLVQRERLMAERQLLDERRHEFELISQRLVAAEGVAAFAAAHARRSNLKTAADEGEAQVARSLARAREAVAIADPDGCEPLDANNLDAALSALHEQLHRVEQCERDAAQARRISVEMQQLNRQRLSAQDRISGHEHTIAQWSVKAAELQDEERRLAITKADLPVRQARVAEAQRLVGLGRDLQRAHEGLEAAIAAHRVLVGQDQALRSDLAQIISYVAEGEAAAARGADIEREVKDVELLLRAKRDLSTALAADGELERTVVQARSVAASAFSAFLSDTAPRLAEELTEGDPCPVCGSCEHPDIAQPPARHGGDGCDRADGQESTSAQTAADVAAAQALVDTAQERLSNNRAVAAHLIETHPELGSTDIAGLTAELNALRSEASSLAQRVARGARSARRQTALERDIDQLAESVAIAEAECHDNRRSVDRIAGALGSGPDGERLDLAELQRSVEAAEAAQGEAVRAARRLDAIVAHQKEGASAADDAARAIQETKATIASLSAEILTAQGLHDMAAQQVQQLMQGRAPAAVGEATSRAIEAIRLAERAVSSADAQRDQLSQSDNECRHELMLSGYGTEAAALGHALCEADRKTYRDSLDAWLTNERRVAESLRMLGAHDLPATAPDIAALRIASAKATKAAAVLRRESSRLSSQIEQAQRDLDAAEARHLGAAAGQQQADLVHRVAGVLGGDNEQRVSFEGWVLAAHLREVVAHANVHLHSMSSGRYALEVATEAADQRSRHGLDLVVSDAFTGTQRSTKSLSGGESFQASLALALGLGDVVCQGRSGLHIDAMFIDEGFGTLDPKAIDQAVGVLDGLRSSGAMIGLITHVQTVKEALPVGFEVGPHPDLPGSTVRLVA